MGVTLHFTLLNKVAAAGAVCLSLAAGALFVPRPGPRRVVRACPDRGPGRNPRLTVVGNPRRRAGADSQCVVRPLAVGSAVAFGDLDRKRHVREPHRAGREVGRTALRLRHRVPGLRHLVGAGRQHAGSTGSCVGYKGRLAYGLPLLPNNRRGQWDDVLSGRQDAGLPRDRPRPAPERVRRRCDPGRPGGERRLVPVGCQRASTAPKFRQAFQRVVTIMNKETPSLTFWFDTSAGLRAARAAQPDGRTEPAVPRRQVRRRHLDGPLRLLGAHRQELAELVARRSAR